jgi:hypothetical protein
MSKTTSHPLSWRTYLHTYTNYHPPKNMFSIRFNHGVSFFLAIYFLAMLIWRIFEIANVSHEGFVKPTSRSSVRHARVAVAGCSASRRVHGADDRICTFHLDLLRRLQLLRHVRETWHIVYVLHVVVLPLHRRPCSTTPTFLQNKKKEKNDFAKKCSADVAAPHVVDQADVVSTK